MKEGSANIPPWESGSMPVPWEESANSGPEDAPHLVSNAEEIDARRAEREHAAELREQERELMEKIENGNYKLPEADVVISQAKQSLVDAVSKLRGLSELSASNLRVVSRAVEGWTRFKEGIRSNNSEVFSTPEETPSVEYDKEQVLSLIEVEKAGDNNDFRITPEGVFVKDENGEEKRMDSVTVNDREYMIPKENLLGKGAFGEVFVGEPVIEAGGELENGDILDYLGIEPEDNLEPTVIKVIRLKSKDERIKNEATGKEMLVREIIGNEIAEQFVGVKMLQDSDGRESAVMVIEKIGGREMKDVVLENRDKLKTPVGRLLSAKAMLSVLGDLKRLHKAGYAHKDVKPANIVLDLNHPEQSRLIDYGIAKSEKDTFDETDENSLFEGTFGYFTGESWKTGESRTGSDIYALGLTFGEAFGGLMKRREFKHGTNLAVMALSQSMGDYVRAPDLDIDDVKNDFFSDVKTGPEKEFAQLLYDIVRPHDGTVKRADSLFENEMMDIDKITDRLEGVIADMEVTSKAIILLENAFNGNAPKEFDSTTADLLEHAIENNDLEAIETLTQDIDSLYSEKGTPRVERFNMLSQNFAKLKDEFTSLVQDNAGTIEKLDFDDRIAEADARLVAHDVSLAEGDFDKAKEHQEEIDLVYMDLAVAVREQKSRDNILNRSVDDYSNMLKDLVEGNKDYIGTQFVMNLINEINVMIDNARDTDNEESLKEQKKAINLKIKGLEKGLRVAYNADVAEEKKKQEEAMAIERELERKRRTLSGNDETVAG